MGSIGLFLPARVNEFVASTELWWDYLCTFWLARHITSIISSLSFWQNKFEKPIETFVLLSLFYVQGRDLFVWLHSYITTLNDDDKIVSEKKVVVGWNILTVLEAPKEKEDADRLVGEASSKAASPGGGRRKNARATSPARPSSSSSSAAPPLSLKEDIADFKDKLKSKRLKLTLITESTFKIEDAVDETSYVDNFVRAAKRTHPDDGPYSDFREDFMILFSPADIDTRNSVFKKLLSTNQGHLFGFVPRWAVIGAVFFFLFPEEGHPLISPFAWALLQLLQTGLFYFWLILLISPVVIFLYSGALASYHNFLPYHKELAEGSYAAQISELAGVKAAQEACLKRANEEQTTVMRGIMNKISESIKSSNWVAFCQRRVRTVPDEFWKRSGIQKDRYLMLATCEKDPSVPSICSRVWLIHPYDLFLLRCIDLKDIETLQVDSNGAGKRSEKEADIARYPFVGHKLRAMHLRQWSLKEFKENGERYMPKKKHHTTFDIIVPDVDGDAKKC